MLMPLAQQVTDSAGTGSSASRNAVAFIIAAAVAGLVVWIAAQRAARPIHLAFGWATAVAMWFLGYIAFMHPGVAMGEGLFASTLACLFAGGFAAARATGSASSGLKVGLVAATVNLLIVGSLFGGGDADAMGRSGLMWVLGLFGTSAALSYCGGVVASRRSSGACTSDLEPISLFTLVSAATVMLLLVTGGLVTGLKAGLAVPDWPNSFGHNMLLYPLSEMKGGIYYEHAHRLFGTLVGLTAIVQAAMVWKSDRRSWTRALALVILAAVIAQGLLGALRVTGTFTASADRADLAPSAAWGVVHGVFAQIVFALVVLLACAQSKLWRSDAQPISSDRSAKDLGWSKALVGALLVQLVLGACYRHLEVPSPDGGASIKPMWAIHAHLTMAAIVLGVGMHAALRGMRHPEERAVLRRFGGLVALSILLQIMLGFTAWMLVLGRKSPQPTVADAIFTTLHQATGALLLAFAVSLAAWMRRLVRV